jgi:hypothetical protein
MEITQAAPIPEIVQLFTNLLWANSPKNWELKSTYHKKTLFVSMLIQTRKIRRSFSLNMINSRSKDLWDFAAECINKMISNNPGK